MHNLYFNSSLKEGISPPQWQGFICSGICFYQLLTLHQKIGFFHPSGRAPSVQESTSISLSLSTKKNWISPPQWQDFICSRIYFYQPITLHQEKINFSTHGRLISQKVGWKVYVTIPLMKITWALNINVTIAIRLMTQILTLTYITNFILCI